jgi:hypothetical protein
VAVIVSTWVCVRLPVKVKAGGETFTVKPGVMFEPAAVQLVGTDFVLRTVRVQVQLGVQAVLRTDGTFRVLGSPPVEGSAARKFAKVSFMTSPALATLVRSTRPVPTSSGSQGVVPFSLKPPLKEVIINADFTSSGSQVGCKARTSVALPVRWGHDIDVPLRLP